MNLGVNSSFAVEIENSEEEVSKQLTSMQGDDDNESERFPQLRSFSRDDVSIFVLLIQILLHIWLNRYLTNLKLSVK